MYLIEIFLPKDRSGRFTRALPDIRAQLVDRFGGVTLFLRTPAKGLWKDPGGSTAADDIVVMEVMAPDLDRSWWQGFRSALEERLDQQEILVRASVIERL